jgi:hypothetical protein
VTWEQELRRALRRLREEEGRRAVVRPAEGPGGPWIAFRQGPDGGLTLETDESDEREVEEREAVEAAADALTSWGLQDGEPLSCFLEGVDRDPAGGDLYDTRDVVRRLSLARLRKRPLVLEYDAAAGPVRMTVAYPNRRWAEVEVVAPKPVNGAQARRLPELGLTGARERWSGRVRADPIELEAIVPSGWARVRDVTIAPG